MLFKKIVVGLLVIVSSAVVADETNQASTPAAKESGLVLTPQQQAPASPGGKLTVEEIKLKIKKNFPHVTVSTVKQSEIPNLYEIDANAGIIYMTDDGNYFIQGDLYKFTETGIKNLTEVKFDKQRKAELAKLDVKDMIVFSPPKDQIKTTITVFTDIDCGYCRKLHSGMAEMNALGIEVRYMAYPRAGLASESYKKLVSAWCADNPQDALTRAKKGESIPEKICVNNPVAKQYELGHGKMGVTGTPAIITTEGRLLPGYMEPKKLAKELGILAASKPTAVAR